MKIIAEEYIKNLPLKLFGSCNISDLVGKTIIKIDKDHDSMRIYCSDYTEYYMYHSQDCCESVYIEDINGDLNDLIGNPVLSAYESINYPEDGYESATWTFYNISTIKGTVVIRWLGTSNGYYSERVNIDKWYKDIHNENNIR